jgi:hypothetical protein
MRRFGSPDRVARGALVLLALLLLAILSLSMLFPRHVTPATAPDDQFSGERAMAAVGIGALWSRLPSLLGWETTRWPDWPEVIPPHGWLLFVDSGLTVLILCVIVYVVARRWSAAPDFSLAGLLPFGVFALALALAIPRAAYGPVWIVIVGSLAWIAVGALRSEPRRWVGLAIVVTVVPVLVLFLPLLPGIFMGDGTKSIGLLAGAWALLLGLVLPAVDGLLVQPTAPEPAVTLWGARSVEH